jgi:TatD DNase family protein
MIDSHCHLAGEEFEADLPAVVERGRAAGLRGALVILAAGDAPEAARAARLEALWPGVRFAVGIHPHQAGEHAPDLDRAIAVLDGELTVRRAAALGEIGLDYHYDFSPREVQQQVFRRQLRLAQARQLPVVLHTREATEDTFRILDEEGGGLRLVFHCFTGSAAMADRALDRGAWLSFAGIVTFPRAAELRDIARRVPTDRLLVETDAPYLAPVPYRGRRNEPAFVARVVEALAELRGTDAGELARQTAANFPRPRSTWPRSSSRSRRSRRGRAGVRPPHPVAGRADPEMGRYIQTSGGKRVRPAVLLMAARLCGYTGERAVLYASVVEFIHTATLVHDDIIDEAELRRGRLAVHSRWGNDITVLLGDYLYIKSMAMALTQDSSRSSACSARSRCG